MRGNHVVWGRSQEPRLDATTLEDRERIAACELLEVEGRRYYREVWKDGTLLGVVRVTAGGQEYKPVGKRKWRHAAFTWGDNDPKWGLAVLALLDQ
jgi:hypothetical protein